MWINMSYLYNKMETRLSEHGVIMMPQFVEELDVWEPVCFILVWSRDDKATLNLLVWLKGTHSNQHGDTEDDSGWAISNIRSCTSLSWDMA